MRRCRVVVVMLIALAAVGCTAAPVVQAPSSASPEDSSASPAGSPPAASSPVSPAPSPPASPAPAAASPTVGAAATFPPPRTKTAGCHFNGALPETACTPGSLNPAVTQATIRQTICVPGYTATIRPPVTESNRLKRVGGSDYGITDSMTNYEGDHLIPLEIGGAPDDIANFWDEKRSEFPGSTEKDQLENYLNKAVCSGRMPLAQAQQSIATNWTAAYCAARLSRCQDGVHFK